MKPTLTVELLKKRFFIKIKKSKCWNWNSKTSNRGYGEMKINGKYKFAHRISWQIHNGNIPHNLCVLHRCDNRKCVKPTHLFLGTRKENNLDMRKKGRDRQLKGEKHFRAKFSDLDIKNIRSNYTGKRGEQVILAKKYNCKRAAISRIINRFNWKHI